MRTGGFFLTSLFLLICCFSGRYSLKYSFEDSGLVEGSFNDVQEPKHIYVIPVIPPPGQLEELKVVTTTSTSVTVTWKKPEQQVIGYECYVAHGGAHGPIFATETQCTITGVIPHGKDFIRVEAYNEDVYGRRYLVAQGMIMFRVNTDRPSVPHNARATALSSTSVAISWEFPQDANGPISGFRLTWNAENDLKPLLVFGRDQRSTTLNNLKPYTNYVFTLWAFNPDINGGPPVEGIETQVKATTLAAAPGAPDLLSAVPAGSTVIALSWESPEDPNGPLDGFIVSWTDGKGSEVTREFRGRQRSEIIREFKPATTYTFTIWAFNLDINGVRMVGGKTKARTTTFSIV